MNGYLVLYLHDVLCSAPIDADSLQQAADVAADRGYQPVVGVCTTLCASVVYPVVERRKFTVDYDSRLAWPTS